jgi:hypothetical protein
MSLRVALSSESTVKPAWVSRDDTALASLTGLPSGERGIVAVAYHQRKPGGVRLGLGPHRTIAEHRGQRGECLDEVCGAWSWVVGWVQKRFFHSRIAVKVSTASAAERAPGGWRRRRARPLRVPAQEGIGLQFDANASSARWRVGRRVRRQLPRRAFAPRRCRARRRRRSAGCSGCIRGRSTQESAPAARRVSPAKPASAPVCLRTGVRSRHQTAYRRRTRRRSRKDLGHNRRGGHGYGRARQAPRSRRRCRAP